MSEQTKKTYKELFTFIKLASIWLNQHKEESKFKHALKRVLTGTKKLQEKYQIALQDILVEHCATDEAGVILTDDRGGFRYTKEGIRARDRAVRELDESVVTIEPYYATEVPELTETELEYFEGFVIKPEAEAAAAAAE